MSTDHRQCAFAFSCDALPEGDFGVTRLRGTEEISCPYRFEIDLYSEDPDLPIDRALASPSRLTIQRDGAERQIYGVVSEYAIGGITPDERHYLYHVVLSPRLFLMSLSKQNQIYGTGNAKTVPDIVRMELTGEDARGPSRIASLGMSAQDFEFRLVNEYRQREYTVQYQESDLDFISRLLEDEGIFYFFTQNGHERVVFCDNNTQTPEIEGPELPFNASSGLAGAGDRAVVTFGQWGRMRPKRVLLRDYNYRLPQLSLLAEQEIDPHGHGVIAEYGAHFRLPEEGEALARARAEQTRSASGGFTGTADAIEMTAGHRFTLSDHGREAMNGEYLLSRVEIEGAQPRPGAAAEGAPSFRCTFEARRAEEPYRPPLRTARPRMTGVMNARIDAEALTGRAEMDEEGRYKVVMPFDLSSRERGKASSYMRLAQPYGGSSQGMHFPLHPGTEVLWACIDGDPDRPILCGVAPNPVNPSVVGSANRDRNMIRTAAGIAMEFSDGAPRRLPGGDAVERAALDRARNFAPPPGEQPPDSAEPPPNRQARRAARLQVARNHDGQANESSGQGDSEDGIDNVFMTINVPSHGPQTQYERGFRTGGDVPEPNSIKERGMRSFLRIGATPEEAIVAGSPRAPIIEGEDGPHVDTSGLAPAELRQFREDGEDLASLVTGFVDDKRDRGPNIDEGDNDEGQLREAESRLLHLRGGWRDHTDGNRITTTRGDKVEVIGGNYKMIILGRQARSDDTGWEASGGHPMEIGAYDEISWTSKFGGTWLTRDSEERGDSYSYSEGYGFEFGRGRSEEIYCGEQFSYFGPIAPPYGSDARGSFPGEHLARIQSVLPASMFDGEWGRRETDESLPDGNAGCVSREVSIATNYSVGIGESYETVFGGGVSETHNPNGLSKEFSWNGRVESIEITGGSASFAIGGSAIAMEIKSSALELTTAVAIEIAASLVTEIFLGGKIDITIGPAIEVVLGKKLEFNPIDKTSVSGSALQVSASNKNLSAIKHDLGAIFLGL